MDTQASIIFLQQCTTWLEKIATAKQKELYYSLEKQAAGGKGGAFRGFLQGARKFLFGAPKAAPTGATTKVQAASKAPKGNNAAKTQQGNNAAKTQQGNPAASDAAKPGWFRRHPMATAALGAAGGGALTYAMTPNRYQELANTYANAYAANNTSTNPTAADLTAYYGTPNDNTAATAFVNSYYGTSGR